MDTLKKEIEKLPSLRITVEAHGLMAKKALGQNFLLDKNKGTIEIIDLDKMPKPYENDLGNALWALTNIEYLNTYLTDSYNEKDPKISDENRREYNRPKKCHIMFFYFIYNDFVFFILVFSFNFI